MDVVRAPTLGGMRRAQVSWLIWVMATVGAAVLDLTFAFRQLWLQPRSQAGDIPWWHLALELVTWPLMSAAVYIPIGLTRALPSPPAFVVLPGRFVAPPAPWLRFVATLAALTAWGAVPVLMVGWQAVAPGDSLKVPAVFGVLLALAATVIAGRVWRRTVVLTPEGLTVREVWDTDVELPWDRAASELVADPRSLRWIDARFLARAVDHYWARPAHRAAIGTPEEHRRLTQVLADPDPEPSATPSGT
jgi:hypothetical protein